MSEEKIEYTKTIEERQVIALECIAQRLKFLADIHDQLDTLTNDSFEIKNALNGLNVDGIRIYNSDLL